MNELVKDYSNDLVIISPKRKKRPKQKETNKKKLCVFCPGNEHLTPPTKHQITNKKGEWIIRVINNKYSFALPGQEHEVIIETRKNKLFKKFNEKEIRQCYEVYQQRFKQLQKKGTPYLFKNEGRNAGASIIHAHSQIITFPKKIRIFKKERFENKKTIRENDQIEYFAPTNSKHAYETILLVKRKNSALTNLTGEEKNKLSQELNKIMKKMDSDYNLIHHDKPYHVHIIPRKTIMGGVELGTIIAIRETSVEDVVKKYK